MQPVTRRDDLRSGLIVMAVGRAPAVLLWFWTITFPPDSGFMAAFIIGFLELIVFVVGVIAGGLLHSGKGSNRRYGLGLLAGWAAGTGVLVLGTVLILLVAGVGESLS